MTRIVLAIALLAPLLATAEVYRWKDDNGNWQFGDRAPESQHEAVDLKPATKIGQGESVNDIHRRTLRLRESEQAERQQKQAHEEKQRRAIEPLCQKARQRLTQLDRPFIYIEDDGSRRDGSPEEARADIARTKQWIEDNCD